MSYSDLVNRFSTTRFGSWVARRFASRIDPWIYRLTGGRFTSTGIPTIPQLLLTTVGRHSGKPRAAQLGYLADGEYFIVFASNFGQTNHPAWYYNLRAKPEARVLVEGRELDVVAEPLSDAAKAALWPRIVAAVPQLEVYVTRTDRNIQLFRLRVRSGSVAAE